MLAVYIFCAALGVPLLALFALGGGDSDVGDAGFDVGDAGFDVGDVGDIGDAGFDMDGGLGGTSGDLGDFTGLIRRVPVSSYAFFLSFFGLMGIVGTALDFGFIATIVLAAIIGVLASTINTAAFAFLRGTDTSSQITDRELTGRLATVSVPIEGAKRGRVWLETGDERVQLTAGPIAAELDQMFERGERVLIVDIEKGVARVMRADPELGA